MSTPPKSGDEVRTDLAKERSRLANVRTLLAWTRTGLAFVGGGIAVMRLLIFEKPEHLVVSKLSGSMLIILGIIIFITSQIDYQKNYNRFFIDTELARSNFPITLMTIVLVITSLLLFIISLRY